MSLDKLECCFLLQEINMASNGNTGQLSTEVKEEKVEIVNASNEVRI